MYDNVKGRLDARWLGGKSLIFRTAAPPHAHACGYDLRLY